MLHRTLSHSRSWSYIVRSQHQSVTQHGGACQPALAPSANQELRKGGREDTSVGRQAVMSKTIQGGWGRRRERPSHFSYYWEDEAKWAHQFTLAQKGPFLGRLIAITLSSLHSLLGVISPSLWWNLKDLFYVFITYSPPVFFAVGTLFAVMSDATNRNALHLFN